MKKMVLTLSIAVLALILQAKTYTMVYENYPPYEYTENGKVVGMDIEILEEAAKLAGITLSFKEYPWARAMKMAEDGEVDGIFSLSKNSEREKTFYYPSTYMTIEVNGIFANDKFSGDVKKIDDLKGKTIGVIADYSYGTEFDNYKGATKEVNTNQETLLKKLEANRYQLAIHNEMVGLHMVNKLGAKNIRLLSYKAGNEPLFVGIPKKSPNGSELLAKLDKALAELEKSGKLKAIRAKYLK